jgi:hypothetical protein
MSGTTIFVDGGNSSATGLGASAAVLNVRDNEIEIHSNDGGGATRLIDLAAGVTGTVADSTLFYRYLGPNNVPPTDTSGIRLSASNPALSDLHVTLAHVGKATGLFLGSSSAPEVRDIDVTVTADFPGNAFGAAVQSGSTTNIRDSRFTVSGAAAFVEGVLANGGPTTLTDSTVTTSASGANGCQALAANVLVALDIVGSNLVAAATTCAGGFSYGAVNQGTGTVTIRQSTVKAATGALFTAGAGSLVKVGGSQLDAPTLTAGSVAATTCVSSYRGNYTAIAGPTCS